MHLRRPGGAINDAAIREQDTAFACVEQTEEVSPICNVGTDYRRSNRGNFCSKSHAISLDFRNPVEMRLCSEMCLPFYIRCPVTASGLSAVQRQSIFRFALRWPSGSET
jgi:hypothetical protein